MRYHNISTVAEQLTRYYITLPHCKAINLDIVQFNELGPTLTVPFQENLQANNTDKIMHGGVITTLVDVTSASAVTAIMPEIEGLATIDLRIDHISPPKPEQSIFCTAQCLNEDNNIAYVRASVYQDDANMPFAIATGTFIRSRLTSEQKALLS